MTISVLRFLHCDHFLEESVFIDLLHQLRQQIYIYIQLVSYTVRVVFSNDLKM